MVNNKRYCVVDVCGTLFSADTTLGLVQAHIARAGSPFMRALLWAFSTRYSPVYLAFLLMERVRGRHFFKHVIIYFLRGATKKELEFTAECYLDHLMTYKTQAAVWSRLRVCDGETLVLASASISPFVAALAARLKCQYVASELECSSGKYTGRLLVDITGEKIERLASIIEGGAFGNISTVISDNLTDKPLLCCADKPVVVLNRSKDRMRWQGLDAEYLETWL
ncbi:HAD family hydrolase [Alloalcanivorax gelatiniphagus]|nr:haloacid dehalogenase-like hydrolase [Alloalcanivorax gelatiniphagus]